MKVSIKDLTRTAGPEPEPAKPAKPAKPVKPAKSTAPHRLAKTAGGKNDGGDHRRNTTWASRGVPQIDVHPQRDAIRRALIAGEGSYRKVAERFSLPEFPLNQYTVARYARTHIGRPGPKGTHGAARITEPKAIAHGRDSRAAAQRQYEELALELHEAEKRAVLGMIGRAEESGDYATVEKLITGGKMGQQLDRAAEYAGIRGEREEGQGGHGHGGQGHGQGQQGGLSHVNVIVIPKDIPGHDFYPPVIEGFSEDADVD